MPRTLIRQVFFHLQYLSSPFNHKHSAFVKENNNIKVFYEKKVFKLLL